MARNLFSIPIFFIVFRETLEASIIVSVLLGLVEQIVLGNNVSTHQRAPTSQENPVVGDETPPIETKRETSPNGNEHEKDITPGSNTPQEPSSTLATLDTQGDEISNKRLVRKLRIQIFLGALAGFLISVAIGAAFIAVWFTQAADLWAKSEDLVEGIFSFIASIIIFVMGVTMLKMDRAKAKWKVKLQQTFDGKHVDSSTVTGKWALFILPFITLLREGMEAVVFVGGVSLGQSATSIPIAAIVGITCGVVVGYIIYAFSSRTSLSVFLIVMTNFLLLIGAGLFSKAIGFFEIYAFTRFVGAQVDDLGGDGPGSYNVVGNVWHLDCCNPESDLDPQGWNIFAALFGWTNSATLGTVLSYVFYWMAVIAALIYLKWREGRTTFLGRESQAGKERRMRRENRDIAGQA
ncbi:iron permease FTR1 [Gautieria morchelliformis]|nr:iron permease FTR1 [Gautieria morchelliformis]